MSAEAVEGIFCQPLITPLGDGRKREMFGDSGKFDDIAEKSERRIRENAALYATYGKVDRMISPLGMKMRRHSSVTSDAMPKRKPFPRKVREEVFGMFGGRCAYCGCPLTMKTLQIDHIHSHSFCEGYDGIDNLLPACRQCNYLKDADTVNGFRRHLMRLVGTFHKAHSSFRMMERYGFVDFTRPPIAFFFEREIEGADEAQRNAFRRMGEW